MKRIMLMLLTSAFALSAFAQYAPGSMENAMTLSLFENEIDRAFQATPEFGTFGSNFLFAGLGNPTAGNEGLGMSEADAWDTSFTAPLKFGYYMAGSFPISIYSSLFCNALTNRLIPSDGVANGYTTKPWVSGTTTTNSKWVSTQTTTDFTDQVFARNWNGALQLMAKLGPATLGLYVYGARDNTTTDLAGAEDAFASTTTVTNYDSAAAGVAPVEAADYTTVETFRNLTAVDLAAIGTGGDGSFAPSGSLLFGIPFAMKTGSLEHRVAFTFGFGSTDNSAAYSYSETAHEDSAGGASVDDRTLSVDADTTGMDFGLSYALTIPAGKGADLWKAEAGLGMNLNMAEYAYDDLVRPYDLSVVGAKTALAGGNHETFASTYGTGIELSAWTAFSRIFRLNLGKDFDYRFAPELWFSFLNSPNSGGAILTGSVTSDQPLTAAGALDNTTPYDTTTVTVTGDPAKQTNLMFGANMPMGFEFKPSGWIFGFLMGAHPAVTATCTVNTSSGETTTATTVNRTGASTNSTTISYVNNTPLAETIVSYTFSEDHYIGIQVPFENGVRLDARLNGNLLAFESFTIQAFIPFK